MNFNKRVLTLNEACAYTGYSQTYMKRLAADGVIQCSKPNGKSLFFEREKLEDWLLSNPRKGLKQKQESNILEHD